MTDGWWLEVGHGEGAVVGKMDKGAKYRFPVIKSVSQGDVRYSMATIVNNAVLLI